MSAEQVWWGNCGHAPTYVCMHCTHGLISWSPDYGLKKRLEELEQRLAALEKPTS